MPNPPRTNTLPSPPATPPLSPSTSAASALHPAAVADTLTPMPAHTAALSHLRVEVVSHFFVQHRVRVNVSQHERGR